MWYFAWLLGLPLAAIFAVMNAMWLELQRDRVLADEHDDRPPAVKDWGASAVPAGGSAAQWLPASRVPSSDQGTRL